MREGWGLLLLLVWACQSWATVVVTDDRHVRVVIEGVPQRLVTLLPSLTETVCELGACNRLVGTDSFSDWPQEVKALPKLGGLYDTSVEAIVRLRPDVVLAAKSTRIIARLESLGIKVVALEPQSLSDVERSIRSVAQVLQLPQPEAAAQRVWQRAMLAMDKAAQSLPGSTHHARVYVEASTGGYAAGEASFIGGILSKLGLKNIVNAQAGAFVQLSPEYVVRASPQWIFLAQPVDPSVLSRPGWRHLPAITNGQMCVFSPAQSQVLVRPGPRIGEAAEVIAACLKRTQPQ